jgi:kynurenine formamidase
MVEMLAPKKVPESRHPPKGPWWPSRFGASDEKGALNLIGPAQALAAAAGIRSGEVIDLGFPFQSGLPDFHHRDFTLASAGAPSGGPIGAARLIYNDELIAGRFTGMSTHFNALVHVGAQLGKDGDLNSIHYYNGFSHADIGGPWGFRRLGIEGVGPIFTPGVLVDLSAYRGRELADGEIISRADFEGALARQDMSVDDIRPGSVLFWRTGKGHRWSSDPAGYITGAAGIQPDTARWLADLGVAIIGADALAMEPVPPVNDRLAEVHFTFLCERGVYIICNVNLQGLAEREAWRFAFSCAPVPFVGAQGSPVRPCAIL